MHVKFYIPEIHFETLSNCWNNQLLSNILKEFYCWPLKRKHINHWSINVTILLKGLLKGMQQKEKHELSSCKQSLLCSKIRGTKMKRERATQTSCCKPQDKNCIHWPTSCRLHFLFLSSFQGLYSKREPARNLTQGKDRKEVCGNSYAP